LARAESWPPFAQSLSFSGVAAGSLKAGRTRCALPEEEAVYDVDFAVGTGKDTKYEQVEGVSVDDY
jgi:hypothetical protein